MRMLLPTPAERVDPADAYAVPGPHRRHLRVNMVSSLDGAAAVSGRVGVLTGPADQELLHLLRSLADVVLVGAGTVRAEGYGALEVDDDIRRRRMAAGQLPEPRLAILTHSIGLDLAGPVFAEGHNRPILVTARDAPADRVDQAREVADVVVAGEQEVDLGTALETLAAEGLPRIHSEGGPHVLAGLIAADLVDELCLTLSPTVTCGDEPRITAGPALQPPRGLTLTQVLEEDDFLFLRYVRRHGGDS